MLIQFFVRGEPKAQPRPKAARFGNNVRIYTPNTAKEWKEAVKLAAKATLPRDFNQIDDPLCLRLKFYLPRPKSHFTKDGQLRKTAPMHHTSRPDTDNLAKAVMDALTDLGVWADDRQVDMLVVEKAYAGTPENLREAVGCSVLLESVSKSDTRKPE